MSSKSFKCFEIPNLKSGLRYGMYEPDFCINPVLIISCMNNLLKNIGSCLNKLCASFSTFSNSLPVSFAVPSNVIIFSFTNLLSSSFSAFMIASFEVVNVRSLFKNAFSGCFSCISDNSLSKSLSNQ